MSKPWKPGREAVDLQPSRIRREPPAPAALKLTLLPDGEVNEQRTVIIGVMLFAVAITFLIFWFSDYTSG